VQGQADLVEVVAALHASRGLADLLHGWQEQPDEDSDDGNYHQQLDQCKTLSGSRTHAVERRLS
jgi:hypothetical protein